jgi:hypothetical protein
MLVAVLACAALAAMALGAASAAAAAPPRWQLSITPTPTHLVPGGKGVISVLAWNLGGAAEGEDPVTITDELPSGMTATSIRSETSLGGPPVSETMACSVSPQPSCTWSKATAPFGESLTPYGYLEVQIGVEVSGPPRNVIDEASIEGGEALPASASQSLAVTAAPAPFGFERFEFQPEYENGSPATQAGSHPFQMTTTIGLNSTFEAGVVKPSAMPKDLHVKLPPGLVGNPNAVPRCTNEQFETIIKYKDLCPQDTAVGVVLVTVREPAAKLNNGREPYTKVEPLFNLTPSPGEPARLGFVGVVVPIVLDTSVRTGSDYGVTVSSEKILQTTEVLASRVTVWGVPGDHAHDASRGWPCLYSGHGGGGEIFEHCAASSSSQPYLTMPTSCEGALESSVEGDSWASPSKPSEVAAPASAAALDETGLALTLDGCDRLPFGATATVQPGTQTANSATGLKFDLSVPQDTTLSPNGLAEADVRDTTVALPEGMQINPASAAGLEACSEGQVGFGGIDGAGTALFAPEVAEPICPNGSKVGNVHIRTPLLAHELEGGAYLAAQDANPFGSLIALYLVARDPVSGVAVKLAGEVTLDQQTGRLVTSFRNTPQVPFEEVELELFSGGGGPLSTPAVCGTYGAGVTLTPWSGGPVAQANPAPFTVTPRGDGTPCGRPRAFSPSISAGSTNTQAQAFTPFVFSLSREDGSQDLAATTVYLPPGLLGKLAAVTPCPEPQASLGTCGPDSEIGHTQVSIGVGGSPYTIPQGRVFITQSYKGAPYGLSFAVPAKAGPFDLGGGPCDCIVVRAKIEVDRHTAALTVASDPLPLRLQGIPVQIRRLSVTTDRPGFVFNPTDCSKLTLSADVLGEEGAASSQSVPFEVANCASLGFRPTMTATSKAHTSRADGASLLVKVRSAPGQADIGSVKVQLPKQLPSRLSTLQKACADSTFNTSPASCPQASVVGSALASTPVLRTPMRGLAYLVSHAGRSFPDLVVVLQGEGITIELTGNTDIKKGITTSTFASLPDAPISAFELNLPTGPHSALGAFGSLCKGKLTMPTVLKGQNGATVAQTTRIGVSGCPAHHRKAAKKRKPRHKH